MFAPFPGVLAPPPTGNPGSAPGLHEKQRIILCEIRFNRCEVRLNTEKLISSRVKLSSVSRENSQTFGQKPGFKPIR